MPTSTPTEDLKTWTGPHVILTYDRDGEIETIHAYASRPTGSSIRLVRVRNAWRIRYFQEVDDGGDIVEKHFCDCSNGCTKKEVSLQTLEDIRSAVLKGPAQFYARVHEDTPLHGGVRGIFIVLQRGDGERKLDSYIYDRSTGCGFEDVEPCKNCKAEPGPEFAEAFAEKVIELLENPFTVDWG